MPRCPSCNKFPSYDTSTEPEVELEVSSEGEISGSVRIVLTSECCGDEVKECSFDVTQEVPIEDLEEALKDAAAEAKVELPKEFGWADVTVDDEFDLGSAELTDRRETTKTDKKGRVKAINPRYQRTYYGFTVLGTVNVTFKKDDKEVKAAIDVTLSDEVQASGMETLN